jgi:hypothetical protein
MPNTSKWNMRVENNCLFIDDVQSGKVVLQHNARPGLRPYIHPLRGPDGVACLTEDSPGHHPWQHGIQTGFHGVNGCEFWEDPGQRPDKPIGKIEPGTTVILAEAPPCWSIDAAWRHKDGRLLIIEQQIWSLKQAKLPGASPVDGLLYLDLDWRMQAVTDVHMVQQIYGGFFIRMPFRKVSGANVLNSEGMKDDDCEQQAAAWVDLYMPIDRCEEGAGLTICDHPGNPSHPAKWRVDGDRGINPSPCIPGAIDLAAGESLDHRYRLILHTGPLAAVEICKHWEAYIQEETA